MSTTALFVEILIIGIQGSIWISLIILSVFGIDWINNTLNSLKDWATLLTLIILAIFYTVGIVLDRIFDALTKMFDPAIPLLKIKYVKNRTQNLLNAERISILKNANALQTYYSYLLSRMRIIRSTFFNIVIIYVTTIVFIISQDIKISILIFVLIFGFLFIVSSLIAYAIIEATYSIRAKQIKEIEE